MVRTLCRIDQYLTNMSKIWDFRAKQLFKKFVNVLIIETFGKAMYTLRSIRELYDVKDNYRDSASNLNFRKRKIYGQNNLNKFLSVYIIRTLEN